MGWFFSGNDDDDDNLFSGSIDLGDLLGSLFGGGLFGGGLFDSVFEEPQRVAHDPYAHLPKKERDFLEKIKIVLGDDLDQIDPTTMGYEAHKMRLYFELEDEMIFDELTEYERGIKQYERENFCHTHKLCAKCYERLEDGICPYCE